MTHLKNSFLTDRQRQVYDLIEQAYIAGRSPSFRELGAELGVTLNAVHGHIKALIKKGYVRRIEDHQSRGLQPVCCPIAKLVDAAYNAVDPLVDAGEKDSAARLVDALQPFTKGKRNGKKGSGG